MSRLCAGALGIVIASLSSGRQPAWAATGSAPETQQGPTLRAAVTEQVIFGCLIVMRPEEIARRTGQIWALMRILPKPHVQKPVGRITQGPNPGEWHIVPYPIDNRRGGIVATVSGLIGQPDRKVYDYLFTPPMGGNNGGEMETFSGAGPFLTGGLCICQIDGTKSGINRFSPHYLIPDGWCDSVVPAFASLQAPTGPFLTGQPAKNAETLKELAMGNNPLLAITAYRLLLAGGWADDRLAERPFKESDPMEQSVLLYILFSHLRDAWWPRIIDDVQRMVNAAATAEQLQPLQMATELAWPLDPFGPPMEVRSHEILKCLQARAAVLGPQAPGAEYLRRFLHMRGMDPVYAGGLGGSGH